MSSYLIQTDKIIGSIVIAGLGITSSLWTNCIFVFNLKKDARDNSYYKQSSDLIFNTVQYEYITLCIITIITLVWGLTKRDKKYLIPWSCLKICENLTIIVGTIIIFPSIPEFTGVIALGACAVCINVFTLYCVYNASLRMLIPLPPEHLKRSGKEEDTTERSDEVVIKIEEEKPLNKETSDTEKFCVDA